MLDIRCEMLDNLVILKCATNLSQYENYFF